MADLGEAFNSLKFYKKPFQTNDYFFTQRTLTEDREYIDKNMNVYQAEDIISNKVNPKIIAKYVRDGETYSIPEFSI